MNDQVPPSTPPQDPQQSPGEQPSEPFINAPAPPEIETGKDAKLYGMLCHILALTGMLGNGIGFFIGPLIIWLIKREEYPFVDDQGKEAVNFQLTVVIGMIALVMGTAGTCGVAAIVTVPLMIALGVVDVVFVIIGGLKANEGIRYRYPFCLRLIK